MALDLGYVDRAGVVRCEQDQDQDHDCVGRLPNTRLAGGDELLARLDRIEADIEWVRRELRRIDYRPSG